MKRKNNLIGHMHVKRQNSRSNLDDTDGRMCPQFIPETKPGTTGRRSVNERISKYSFSRNMSDKNRALSPGRTTGGSSVATRSKTADGLNETVFTASSCSFSEPRIPCGHSAVAIGEESMDFSSDSTGGARAQYSLRPRCHIYRSAGANMGLFPFKGGNNSQSVSNRSFGMPSVSNGRDSQTSNVGAGLTRPTRGHCSMEWRETAQNLARPGRPPVTRTRPRRSKNRRSDLETDDLDVDIIFAMDVKVEERKEHDTPDLVPGPYATSDPLKRPSSSGCIPVIKKAKEGTSQIYIYHPLATDDPRLGDRFGASLDTTKKHKDGYYRHIIKYVDVNGVADNMKIRDGDELVLINSSFVPELDHQTVLKLFQEVPVDHHTRFSLVLRRWLPDKTWEWVSTSAILVPELEREPRVRELQFETDKCPTKIFHHWYRIQIPGTQLYLIISKGEIRAEVSRKQDMKDFKIGVMTKCTVSPSTGDFSYFACIFGVNHEKKNQNDYVYVENTGNVCLRTEPQWFGFGLIGREMEFKDQGLQKYLGCVLSDNATHGHLCVQEESFKFRANGLEDSYDHPDTDSVYSTQPSSFGSSFSSSHSARSGPNSLRLSDTSMSSMGSCSSGSDRDSGCHLNLRPRTYEDPVSDSGSEFFSVTNDSCGTPNTPMASLSLFSERITK